MNGDCAVVITTINGPTRAIQAIARGAQSAGAKLIIVGDRKTPDSFDQSGSEYFSLDAQNVTGFHYASYAPKDHYARKNVGYLIAMRQGAKIIIDTDDDNIPSAGFWDERNIVANTHVVDVDNWVNIYRYFSTSLIWPRGFPLDRIRDQPPALSDLPVAEVMCPIQQGLVNGDPDVDAIFRLSQSLPFNFESAASVMLRGAWCPFNSQNTTWWKQAFPLLYLPHTCSFRMTDIWRSFVAQQIIYENNWGVLFHAPTVFQDRNEHNILHDFQQEIPGYLGNARIREVLKDLILRRGQQHIAANMIICYRALIEHSFIEPQELPLLEAWLNDLQKYNDYV